MPSSGQLKNAVVLNFSLLALKFEYTIQNKNVNVKTTFCFCIQNPEEVEMAEDFDELTQSSDTATDDNDSPTSGYRHASLLIQNLDSATLGTDSNANGLLLLSSFIKFVHLILQHTV